MGRPSRKGVALAGPIVVFGLGSAFIAQLDASARTRTSILIAFMVLTIAVGLLLFRRASKGGE